MSKKGEPTSSALDRVSDETLRAVDSHISAAHIAELTRQRDLLLAQVEEMRALIQTIPSIITGARLDAKEGIPTQYDYERHAKVTQVRV